MDKLDIDKDLFKEFLDASRIEDVSESQIKMEVAFDKIAFNLCAKSDWEYTPENKLILIHTINKIILDSIDHFIKQDL